MSQRVWIYNYDFEFELANQKKVIISPNQKQPWWHLNRSSSILIPLTESGDKIVTYQQPQPQILSNIKNKIKTLPEFIELDSQKEESNSLLTDLSRNKPLLVSLSDHNLFPWGWSPTSLNLAQRYFTNKFPDSFKEVACTANSKQYSDFIRTNYLPESFQIPSLQINEKDISSTRLKELITDFISLNSQVKIKHYFGASGRLADTITKLPIPENMFYKWKSWINDSGGILLEKYIAVKEEYSIQAEINANGAIRIFTLMQLFSNKHGSYLGNLTTRMPQSGFSSLTDQLHPLFQQLLKLGYVGPLGIDLIKTTKDVFKFVELNSRLTMGRVAYEWNEAINTKQFGFFTNFFVNSPQFTDISEIIRLYSAAASQNECDITIINSVQSHQKPITLITIFVGANTKNALLNALSQINPVLFQGFTL